MLGLGIFSPNAVGRCFMLTPFRITVAIVVLLVFAGLIYSQPQAAAPAAEQFQATLKRLQSEIGNLQGIIAQLKAGQKNETVKEPGAASPQNPTQNPTQDSATSRAKQARAAYNDARRLEDQKLYRAAVDAFADAIHLDPLNDAAFLHRGYCYHQLGDDAAAVADFTQSLTLQPDNSSAYVARATANAATGQRAQALNDADEAIRRDPKNTEAYLLRGRLYQQQGDSERSLADFNLAQSLSPKSEQPYLGRAETNLQDGKTDEAMADCDAAVRLNPNSFAAYLCRAHAYIQMGKSDRAVAEISRASRAAQSLDLPLAFLNDTWRALDPKLDPRSPAANSPRTPGPAVPAKTLEPAKAGSAPLAAVASQSARATPDPFAINGPASLERMAFTLIGQRNFAGAFVLLNRAIAIDPTRAQSYNTRGLLHLWLWHHDLAIADFSEAIRLNPALGSAYRNRANVRRALGDRKLAAEDDSKAEALSANARASVLAAKR